MLKFRFKSIHLRLTVWLVVILGTIIFITDFFIYKSYQKTLMNSIDNTLYLFSEELEHSILKLSRTELLEEIQNIDRELLTNIFFIQIHEIEKNTALQVIAYSDILSVCKFPRGKENLNLSVRNSPEYITAYYKSEPVHPIRIIYFPVIKGDKARFIIQVGTSLKESFQILRQLIIVLLVLGPLMLILCSIGGYLILSGAINPIKAVVNTAKNISTDNLSDRLDTQGRVDEIGELIQTFNQMIERLQMSVTQIKQFSSDVSHELKTPLTVIRGEIELALRKERENSFYLQCLNSVYEESNRMLHIIDNLMLLSKIDFNEKMFIFEIIPLFEILDEKLDIIKTMAEPKNIEVKVKEIVPIYVNGVAELIRRMIMNLADNAIKYTLPGGQIEISLNQQDDQAVFSIKDNGIGIPEESLPFVFDRFYRVDHSRSQMISGFGLGLSIVKRIVNLHSGKIAISSKINQGTTVTVWLPVKV